VRELAARILALPSGGSATPEPAVEPSSATALAQPISYGQRALWFLHLLSPESGAYNLAFAARVSGELDVACLRGAFQRLVDRHPALRTTFTAITGEPAQRIHEGAEVCFQQKDVAALSEAGLNDLLAEQAYTAFDLENGPLFRVTLLSRSAREHVLLLTMHHIISDLWTVTLLVDEFTRAYAAEVKGEAIAFKRLPADHTDFARWQSQMQASPEWERLWAYWQEELSGDLPLLSLPTDRPRPPAESYRGSAEAFELGGELAAGLKQLGRAHGATLYVTLLAAFQAFLYRYSGQKDFLVGTPTTGRT